MEKKTSEPALPSGRYFKYAIGEIVLVVIGILIALQINNWNEARKQKELENNLLFELTIDIRSNIRELERSMLRNKKRNHSSNMVIRALKQDLPFHDSIAEHFTNTHGMDYLNLNSTAFETLKSQGLTIISSDSLRKKINLTFKGYEWLKSFLNRVNAESDNTLNKYQQKYQIILEATSEGLNNQPVDYEGLKDNFEYINTLQDNTNNLYGMVKYEEAALVWNKKLLEDLNIELQLDTSSE